MRRPPACIEPPDNTQVLVIDPDAEQALRMARMARSVQPGWQIHHVENLRAGRHALLEASESFELALLGTGLPMSEGLQLIQLWRKHLPMKPLLVLMHPSSAWRVLDVIRAGASGCLHSEESPQELASAIGHALQGLCPISASLSLPLFELAGSPLAMHGPGLDLSRKEHETLEHLSQGHGYALTAQLMGVRVSTVQSHVRRLYRKLDVHSQMQAVVRARQLGLLHG